MADPFEVRVRFSAQLQNLNASVASAQKAAAYALKYKDMEEDLHSCIIEQLEKPQTAPNKRVNILYFLEHFLELAQREGHNDYVGMLQRDIIRVVDAVAPESGQGAANVKGVRKVLQALQHKGFLERQAVTEIEEVLREREADLLSSPAPAAAAVVVVNGADGTGQTSVGGPVVNHAAGATAGAASAAAAASATAAASASAFEAMDVEPPSQTIPETAAAAAAATVRRLDRKQIGERIEEDRERHKRLRESIWAVPKGADAEMWKLWDETSDLGEDDHLMGEEEQADRAQTLQTSCVHRAVAAEAAAMIVDRRVQ